MGTVALLGGTQEPGGFTGGRGQRQFLLQRLPRHPGESLRPCDRQAGEPDTETAGRTRAGRTASPVRVIPLVGTRATTG